MEFRCVEECSDCCVQREYYPTKQFGKIGVLILPNEKEKIEKFPKENKIEIKISDCEKLNFLKDEGSSQHKSFFYKSWHIFF